MRKIVAAFNMTLDGFCDHTLGVPDEKSHLHYAELLRTAGTLLYGRITYELMENHWPTLVKEPSGNKGMDDFALAIDSIPKVVFSRTLKNVNWESARIATRDLKEEVLALRQQPGNDIVAGSRSIIIALLNLGLIDEFQLFVQHTLAGSGSGIQLFENINGQIELKLLKTETFSNSILLYYQPLKK